MIAPCRRLRYALVPVVSLTLSLNAAATGEENAPRFEDITQAAGLEGLAGHHAAWGDYNNDDHADLWSDTQIWQNEGGTFNKTHKVPSRGIWGDYDRDGFVDLFCYATRGLFRNLGGERFEEVTEILAKLPMTDTRGAAWGDFNGDRFLDLYVGAYENPSYSPDAILISESGKRFKLTWQQSGDIDPARGITAADYDEDGDLDIYVSNYRLEQNQLWKNDGAGTFTNVGADTGVDGIENGFTYSYGHTIGSAFGDLDDDGHIDLFVGNFSHAADFQDRARVYQNLGAEGDWKFKERKVWDGPDWQESYASPTFGDIDNDGDLDLFFTTVYGGDNPRLYRNDGDFTFVNVTEEWGLAGLDGSYQAAFADYDNDGDLDLVTAGKLFRNVGGTNHYLKVRLDGNGTHDKTAIGTIVRIRLNGRTLTRQVESAVGEGNQNEHTLHFGLGDYDGPVTLEITWPGGERQSKVVDEVDRLVTIVARRSAAEKKHTTD